MELGTRTACIVGLGTRTARAVGLGTRTAFVAGLGTSNGCVCRYMQLDLYFGKRVKCIHVLGAHLHTHIDTCDNFSGKITLCSISYVANHPISSDIGRLDEQAI